MPRTPITDRDTGDLVGYFYPEKATAYAEDTYWNGNNHISCATGSQWDHETLYRTPGGKWVLYHTSAWQGSIDAYRLIDDGEAALWLVANNQDAPEVAEQINAMEIL